MSGIQEGDVRQFRSVVDGRCPFCSGTYGAGYYDGECALMHSLPPCGVFEALEPDEYLAQVRSVVEMGPQRSLPS